MHAASSTAPDVDTEACRECTARLDEYVRHLQRETVSNHIVDERAHLQLVARRGPCTVIETQRVERQVENTEHVPLQRDVEPMPMHRRCRDRVAGGSGGARHV